MQGCEWSMVLRGTERRTTIDFEAIRRLWWAIIYVSFVPLANAAVDLLVEKLLIRGMRLRAHRAHPLGWRKRSLKPDFWYCKDRFPWQLSRLKSFRKKTINAQLAKATTSATVVLKASATKKWCLPKFSRRWGIQITGAIYSNLYYFPAGTQYATHAVGASSYHERDDFDVVFIDEALRAWRRLLWIRIIKAKKVVFCRWPFQTSAYD